MSKYDVTIGICAKDAENYIGNAIISIMLQTYPHDLIEIIFVDDGSKDNTLSVIKNYVKNIDIKYKLYSYEWKGLGFARNIVVENSEGKYIVWVDSDMILTKNFIKTQIEFMESNKNLGVGIGFMGIRPKDNLILTLEVINYIFKYNYKLWNSNNTTKLPGTAGIICRVKAIKQVRGFDFSISGAGEDQDLFKKIKDAGWLIRQTGAIFYETHGNMSSWRDLWRKYIWYGLSASPLYHRGIYKISILRMNPFSGFLSGIILATRIYPIFSRKIVFLSPIHYSFKMFAWLWGFSKVRSSY